MVEFRTDFRGEVAEFRNQIAEFRSEIVEFRTEIAGFRGEIELGMARNLRVQVAANFASMLTLAAFIIGFG